VQVSGQCTRPAEAGTEVVEAQEALDGGQALQVIGPLQLLGHVMQGGGGGGALLLAPGVLLLR
jgi:hypothetical protein